MNLTDASDIILEIEKSCFLLPYTREMIESDILNTNSILLIADDRGKIYNPMMHEAEKHETAAGYCLAIAVPSENILELHRIAVKQNFRRRGIARQLIGNLEAIARKKHLNRILLEVSAGNHEAVIFYETSGFSRYSIRKAYYSDGTDAQMYQKIIELRAERG